MRSTPSTLQVSGITRGRGRAPSKYLADVIFDDDARNGLALNQNIQGYQMQIKRLFWPPFPPEPHLINPLFYISDCQYNLN